MTDTSTGNADKRQCEAVTRSGAPCNAWALAGSAYCFWHAPEAAGDRAAARQRGGQARHGRKLGTAAELEDLSFERLADALGIVAQAIQDTGRLENSVSRNRALGYLASVALKAFEITELAGRLDALERILSQREGNQ